MVKDSGGEQPVHWQSQDTECVGDGARRWGGGGGVRVNEIHTFTINLMDKTPHTFISYPDNQQLPSYKQLLDFLGSTPIYEQPPFISISLV